MGTTPVDTKFGLPLRDKFHRNINYLRVSITDRCNLRCSYCMPDEKFTIVPHQEILRYEEILRLVEIFAGLGITKIRVTGGEPLVRKGVYTFLEDLGKTAGIEDIAITTNGLLLTDNIEKIAGAGIKRINVSLDSLNPETYRQITGRDGFKKVWDGILEAHKTGFSPIKINAVALRGVNDVEFYDLAALTFKYPFHIRFIEHMPVGISDSSNNDPVLSNEIKESISKLGKLIPVENDYNDGPAERYRFENGVGEVGFIEPLSHRFCGKCNRLRLTSCGELRTCLLSEKTFDLKGLMRRGASDDDLRGIVLKAVSEKPLEHFIRKNSGKGVESLMSSIGG